VDPDGDPTAAQTAFSGPASVINSPTINTRLGIIFGLGSGFVLPAVAHSGALYQW
jgi:hypothetical protein